VTAEARSEDVAQGTNRRDLDRGDVRERHVPVGARERAVGAVGLDDQHALDGQPAADRTGRQR
jgi:hypothetical protein